MPFGGVQRLVTLPPAPESARQARRFVAAVVTAAGGGDFLETATLLTSELVTNGIVHAHTELQVVVEATRRWVRVEVIDGNPMLPARRDYDEEAQTGRGLEMVELLADDFGMQQLEDDGKRVWFTLGHAGATPNDDETADVVEQDLVCVRLLRLPVMLYSAWQEHADAMLREATLVALNNNGGELPEEYSLASQALSALAGGTGDVFALRDTGPSHVDVELALPRAVVPNFPVLRDLLRRCSERSVAGELLVPPSLPEIQAVRRWVCDEIGRQGQGLAPSRWVEIAVEEAPDDPLSVEAADEVRASTTAQIAADRRNRIIAVSATAAALLGWPERDLQGQRLVTIIPPQWRDAHVAGFTRSMLGGAPRILDHDVAMTAWHRDGYEVPVTLLIQRRFDSHERPLFVATLTPRD